MRLGACHQAWARRVLCRSRVRIHGRAVAMGSDAASGTPHSSPLQLPPPDRIRAVLFDIDGTLTHSDDLHFAVFRDMLQQRGFNGGTPISEDFYNQHISGRHNPLIFADLFPELPESEREVLIEMKEARFRDLAHSALKPVPGLLHLVDTLRRSEIAACAVTNAPRANACLFSLIPVFQPALTQPHSLSQAELMLRALQLDEFFGNGERLVIGAECAQAKPHPEPYLEGLRRVGVPAEETIAFEDSPSGMAAAVAAKLATFGLSTTQSADKLLGAGAIAVINDFRDAALWKALGERCPQDE